MSDVQPPPANPGAPAFSIPSDIMRNVLATASTALVGFALIAPAFHVVIDGELKGAVLLQWGLVMGYYFGTSKSSAGKDATIGAMAKAAAQ